MLNWWNYTRRVTVHGHVQGSRQPRARPLARRDRNGMITSGKLILLRLLPTCRTRRMIVPLGRHLKADLAGVDVPSTVQ